MKTYIETRIKELKEELKTLPESSEDAYYVRGVMDGLEEMKMFYKDDDSVYDISSKYPNVMGGF